MKRTTREWVTKAEDDYRLAAQVAGGSQPFHDQVCFHCQQSAEKYLKALLEELALLVPKTHDCEELLDLIRPHHHLPGTFRRGLAFLSNYAVAVRYPGEWASKRQSSAALRWAGRVRAACRGLLGLVANP